MLDSTSWDNMRHGQFSGRCSQCAVESQASNSVFAAVDQVLLGGAHAATKWDNFLVAQQLCESRDLHHDAAMPGDWCRRKHG